MIDIRAIAHVVANFAGKTRRERLQGAEHIVADIVLLRPGVFSGSKGALFYPEDEIAKSVQQWEGVPLVVNHPYRDGRAVSARSQEIRNEQGIGIVLSSRIQRGALTAAGWFDVKKTTQVDSRVLAALESGRRIEVSTGLLTTIHLAPAGATYNGRPYSHIARNLISDHLAILPDQTGACSVKDGCGVFAPAEDDQ